MGTIALKSLIAPILVSCPRNMFDKFCTLSYAKSVRSRLPRLSGICGTAH